MQGTYVGAKFNLPTKLAIEHYCRMNKVSNPVATDDLHTTIIYSRKYFEFEAQGRLKTPIVCVPDNFDIWTSDKTNKKCLVLKFSAKALVDRHNYLMKKYDATYDYDTYKTHVTFSYDIGDRTDFPIYKGPLVINYEYTEELDLEWSS